MFTKKVEMKYKEEQFAKPLNLADFPHVHTSDLLKIVNYLPKCGVGGPWIAGGSVWRTINNEPLNKCDIDVFFHDKEQFNEAVTQMDGYPFIRNVLKKTKNKWNISYKIHANRGVFNKTIEVQFICMKFHKSIDALLQSFDFTVCQFVWNGENIYAASNSIDDLRSRLIRIYKTGNPKSLFEHMLRYMDNGFTLKDDETKKLISNILSMNPWDKAYTKGYNDPYEKAYDGGYDYGAPTGITTGVVGGGRNAWGQTEREVVDTYNPPRAPIPAINTGNVATEGFAFTTNQTTQNFLGNTPVEIHTDDTMVGWDEPTEIEPNLPTGQVLNLPTGQVLYRNIVTTPTEINDEIIERGMPEPIQEQNVRPTNQRWTVIGEMENDIQRRLNTPRYETPRAARGPGRFEEDRRNPNFRTVFTGETNAAEIVNEPRRAIDGEQQERR